RQARIISSDMPFFMARLALCRTCLDVSIKRNLKKSNNVAFDGIGGSFFTFLPGRGTYMKPTPSRYFLVSICASTSATVGYFLGFVSSHAGSPVFARFNSAIMWDSRASARASESIRPAASGPSGLAIKFFWSIFMEAPRSGIPTFLPYKTVDPGTSGVNLEQLGRLLSPRRSRFSLRALCWEFAVEKSKSTALTQRTQRKTRARRNPAYTQGLPVDERNFLVRSGLSILGNGRMKFRMVRGANMRNIFGGTSLVHA